jgi:predicted membrane protein
MGLFWGLLLVVVGLGIIINIVFGVHIPILKTLLALFLIFLGVKLLLGNWWSPWCFHGGKNEILLHERTITSLPGEHNEFDIVFGKGTFDLRNLSLNAPVTTLNVDTVFGGTEILLTKGTPVKIDADVAFGGATLPDQETGGFGRFTYQSENFKPAEKYLYIKASAVFGGVEIRYR